TTAAFAGGRAGSEGIAAEDSAPYRVALAELSKIEARNGTLQSRTEILVNNLSRYFVVYLVPSDQEELRRVLGTAQRMTQQVARILYRGGQAAATQSGASRVEAVHIERVLESLLPSRPSTFGETVFFPEVSPTPLEEWDLRALADTGLAWEALGALADTEVATATAPLAMSEEAARRIAEGVNAYGLLVFRLGGQHAKASLDTHVRTSHLREAGKTIRDRAEGKVSPILESPQLAEAGSLFSDVTDAVGIDFRHVTAEWLGRFRRYGPTAPTFSGGGVAAGDLDGDGWDDLVLCGGRGCRSFANRQGQRFEETTATTKIGVDGEARSPLLADFDNDGDPDLFVTYARDTNRLFENLGDGRFRDITETSGLVLEGDISGPATTADFNGDGLLDLYVGNFGNYLGGDSAWVALDAKNAMPNRLYLQSRERPLTFVESPTGGDEGWAQALSHLDYDLDGDQDLYVANDFGRNQLLRNDGSGRFESAGAATRSDDPHHGMNVAFADLNRDRRPDIFVTNIWFWASAKREVTETNTLLLSDEDGGYADSDAAALLDHDSGWAWAALFFDVENDGDDDLFVANGFTDYMTFVQYRKHPETPDQLYPVNNGRSANLFFRGDGSGLPSELVEGSGVELAGINSRSAALLDYDRDGDLDLVVTTFHEQTRLFRNDSDRKHRALSVQLVGDPAAGSSRDAIGATVVATGEDGFYAWRAVQGGEGYLGMNTLAVEIGAGDRERLDLEIVWPNGERQSVEAVATGRALRIEQGREEPTLRWAFDGSTP
ncbi:MAG: CRTAC1 family protein, partial [Acidobacteriota bacterium]